MHNLASDGTKCLPSLSYAPWLPRWAPAVCVHLWSAGSDWSVPGRKHSSVRLLRKGNRRVSWRLSDTGGCSRPGSTAAAHCCCRRRCPTSGAGRSGAGSVRHTPGTPTRGLGVRFGVQTGRWGRREGEGQERNRTPGHTMVTWPTGPTRWISSLRWE